MPSLEVVAGVIVSLGVIYGLLRGVATATARMTRVHDVILGTDESPGVAQRLEVLETRTLQLVPNGGGSLKDDVKLLRAQLAEMSRKQDEDRDRVSELRGAQTEQVRLLQHDMTNIRATTTLLTDLVRQTMQGTSA